MFPLSLLLAAQAGRLGFALSALPISDGDVGLPDSLKHCCWAAGERGHTPNADVNVEQIPSGMEPRRCSQKHRRSLQRAGVNPSPIALFHSLTSSVVPVLRDHESSDVGKQYLSLTTINDGLGALA